MRTGEIFRREIRNAPRVYAAVILNALNSALEDSIRNRPRKREIQIVFGRHVLEPTHPATEIVKKGLLNFVGSKTGADCPWSVHARGAVRAYLSCEWVHVKRSGCPVAASTECHQPLAGSSLLVRVASSSIGTWIKRSCRKPMTTPVFPAIAACTAWRAKRSQSNASSLFAGRLRTW